MLGAAVIGTAGALIASPLAGHGKAANAEPVPEKSIMKPLDSREKRSEGEAKIKHRKYDLLLKDAAGIIGISEDDLKNAVKSGKSIAEAAKEKGISEAELTEKLLAKRLEKIDEAVKAGRWTEEKAEKVKASLPDRLKRLVNHKGEWKPDKSWHHSKDQK